MNEDNKKIVIASLVADAYSLGAHWIYDEDALKSMNINWNELNPPEALWHKGKQKGDFTHYGDQTLFLLEYVSKNKTFNRSDFYTFWKEKMSSYDGYIDGSSRDALQNIGAVSHDLSICGRIAPLLIEEPNKEKFLENVASFVGITHNSELAQSSSRFFAELLWLSMQNHDIAKNIQEIKLQYPLLIKWVDEGVKSKDKDTFTSIREFGPACGVDGGFAGVIHLLSLDDNFKSILIKNAKAGGDSSARGMVIAMILATKEDVILPNDWIESMNKIVTINQLLG